MNLAANISQQSRSQIIVKTAAVNGGIQAGTDNGLTRDPLDHFVPVTIADLG